MIRKIAIPLLLPCILLQSCFEDPDPIPQTIDTYHSYYNYLLESYSLQWEIDDEIIGSGHSYGVPASAFVSLSEAEQDVLIRSRNSDNGQLIDSLVHTMYENGSYLIALMGSEDEPHLICVDLDTRPPSGGNIKYRILHTSEAMGPVDIYIGGDEPDFLTIAEVDFTDLSENLEATEEHLWTSITITPANTLPADSTILKNTANTVFRTGRSYLITLEHSTNSNESSFQMQVDDQPVY